MMHKVLCIDRDNMGALKPPTFELVPPGNPDSDGNDVGVFPAVVKLTDGADDDEALITRRTVFWLHPHPQPKDIDLLSRIYRELVSHVDGRNKIDALSPNDKARYGQRLNRKFVVQVAPLEDNQMFAWGFVSLILTPVKA